MKGWQIPAYPLPVNMDNVIIQRMVCRADLSQPMAEEMIGDLKEAIKELNEHRVITPEDKKVQGFIH
jgi:glutamate decarboxylase